MIGIKHHDIKDALDIISTFDDEIDSFKHKL